MTNDVEKTRANTLAYLFILIPISTRLVVAYDFNHNGIQIEHCCPIILYLQFTFKNKILYGPYLEFNGPTILPSSAQRLNRGGGTNRGNLTVSLWIIYRPSRQPHFWNIVLKKWAVLCSKQHMTTTPSCQCPRLSQTLCLCKAEFS